MRYDAAPSLVTGRADFAEDGTAAWAVLHVRLPDGMKVISVDSASKAERPARRLLASAGPAREDH